MRKAKVQILDIDMGSSNKMRGPEAVQFSCPGGQITLYGTPPWHTMTNPPHTIDEDWYTVPGGEGKTLDRYIYDCPGDDKVTFWSKRSGTAEDNPTSADMNDHSELTMDSLVQVEFVDTTCTRFNFANMPPGYRQEAWEAQFTQPGNRRASRYSHPGYSLAHAADGGNPLNQTELPLDANFPAPPAILDRNGNVFVDEEGESSGELKARDCAAAGGGRNFQFAGFYNPNDLTVCDPPPPSMPPPMPPPTPPPPSPAPPPPTPVSIGGDPVFHSGDSWLKFRLKDENHMTKILSWTQPSGRVYHLLGSTFSSKMKGSEQWFNRLAIHSNNINVLEVDIGDRHKGKWFSKTMTVKVDGTHLDQESKYTHEGEFQVTLKPRLLKPCIGANQAERLLLHWGHGYEFEISSSLASAFPKHTDLQEKWAHLNVHFDKLPGGSSGLLAQFAGIEAMSESVRALVVNTDLQ